MLFLLFFKQRWNKPTTPERASKQNKLDPTSITEITISNTYLHDWQCLISFIHLSSALSHKTPGTQAHILTCCTDKRDIATSSWHPFSRKDYDIIAGVCFRTRSANTNSEVGNTPQNCSADSWLTQHAAGRIREMGDIVTRKVNCEQ